MKRLTGHIVLVTGASSGFGRAIALACAAEGADLALVARREAVLADVAAAVRAEGVRAVVCPADVADESQVVTAVARTRDQLGPIDVLVNNAGLNIKPRTIRETGGEQWRRLLEVNLTGAFLFTQAVLPEMIARRRGTIINLASRAAIYPNLVAGTAYSVSKLGLVGLTQVTNEEANPHHVRACLLCPGVGNTPILDQRPQPPPPAQRLEMLQPEDIAAIVVLVASLPARVNIEEITLKPTWAQLGRGGVPSSG